MASLSTDAASPHRRLIYVRDLLRELVLRDLKLRYKRSALGIGWSLLNPLAQVLVFTFLFRVVVPLGIPDYHLFVFTGVLAWSWFQQSVVAATGAITDNRELIRQPGFPAAVLPAVTVAADRPLSDFDRAGVRATATHVTGLAARVVDTAHALGGGTSVYDSSPLQRRLRDIHTATQHFVAARDSYAALGALLVGEDAGTGPLLRRPS